MKVIPFDAEIVKAESCEKLVEIIGRTCYKSEDKVTEESYRKFLHNLITRKHFAMLEHGRITFQVTFEEESDMLKFDCKLNAEIMNHAIPKVYTYIDWDSTSLYMNVSLSHLCNTRYNNTVLQQCTLKCYADCGEWRTTKHKVDMLDNHSVTIRPILDESELDELPERVRRQFKHISIKFICDRGVSHELVRHRFAIAQESQRYCKYGSGKFGIDILFVLPERILNDTSDTIGERELVLYALKDAEAVYLKLLELGQAPQSARRVLPNATKTEVILTANLDEWTHFFDMRYRGTTGAPHPDMIEVATIAHNKVEKEYGYAL